MLCCHKPRASVANSILQHVYETRRAIDRRDPTTSYYLPKHLLSTLDRCPLHVLFVTPPPQLARPRPIPPLPLTFIVRLLAASMYPLAINGKEKLAGHIDVPNNKSAAHQKIYRLVPCPEIFQDRAPIINPYLVFAVSWREL